MAWWWPTHKAFLGQAEGDGRDPGAAADGVGCHGGRDQEVGRLVAVWKPPRTAVPGEHVLTVPAEVNGGGGQRATVRVPPARAGQVLCTVTHLARITLNRGVKLTYFI